MPMHNPPHPGKVIRTEIVDANGLTVTDAAKVREVIKVLKRAGWRHVRTAGDHRVFRNTDGRTTVVSGRLGDDVRPGTYQATLRQTGIEEDKI